MKWKPWYFEVIVGIIALVIFSVFNFSFIWVVITILAASLVGSMFDGIKTDMKVEELEERIKNLEKKD